MVPWATKKRALAGHKNTDASRATAILMGPDGQIPREDAEQPAEGLVRVFSREYNPANGLVRDNTNQKSPSSIAVVGFSGRAEGPALIPGGFRS